MTMFRITDVQHTDYDGAATETTLLVTADSPRAALEEYLSLADLNGHVLAPMADSVEFRSPISQALLREIIARPMGVLS